MVAAAFALIGCGEEFSNGAADSSGGGSPIAGATPGGASTGAGGQATASGGSGAGGAEASGAGGLSMAMGGRGAGGASSAGSGGSSNSGNSGASGDTGGTCSKTDSPAVAACTVIESLGVFVSPKGSDDKGRGTRESPFQTLRKAIGEARKQSKRVYARSTGGAFHELLTLDADSDQTEIYGGFDCIDWTYSADAPTSVISDSPRALVGSDLTALVVEDFSFTAANATQAGDSSAAAWFSNSKNVVLRRVSLTAGTGADGADGAGTKEAAAQGQSGINGAAACSVPQPPNDGAMQVETLCDGEPTGSIGGAGGDGGTDGKGAGTAAAGEPIGAELRGQPGYGQAAATSWNCGVGPGLGGGQMGSDAMSQPAANGAMTSMSDAGALTSNRFVGASGQDGVNGAPGQGGGGGGGAIAPRACSSGAARTGASGGSGGGGGCGGKGGKGGGAGGGSFALVSFRSSITLENGVLTAQRGGNGGHGGYGQPGGAGGPPGAGGSGYSEAVNACSGGAGGKGGDGGHGGGGAGGPSAAIAYAGFAPIKLGTPLLKVASTPSSGGDGGAGTRKGPGVGSAGVVSEVLGLGGG